MWLCKEIREGISYDLRIFQQVKKAEYVIIINEKLREMEENERQLLRNRDQTSNHQSGYHT
jgi:hypothetical protein